MARKPRIHIEGAFYHVMLRGNAGQKIFSSSEHFLAFENLVEEGVERFGHRIHAYCWMPNHVHMAVEVGQEPLSKIMQNVSFRYTRWYNKRENQRGHLFQGRFKAILIEEERYLLELVRYIHLNPVRADITKNPEEYPWSGHSTYIGRNNTLWLTQSSVLSRFGQIHDQTKTKYQEFIMEGIGEGRRPEFHAGPIEGRLLGSENFVQNMVKKREHRTAPLTLDIIIAKTCAYYEIEKAGLLTLSRLRTHSQARFLIALIYTEHGKGILSKVAELFSRDIATMSSGIYRIRQRLKTDLDLQKAHRSILEAINQ